MNTRLEQLEKIYQTDQTDAFLPYGIALEYGKLDQLEDAIVWLDKTIKIDPSYCYAYFQKAKMLCEIGEDDQAKDVLAVGISKATQANDSKAISELQELLSEI